MTDYILGLFVMKRRTTVEVYSVVIMPVDECQHIYHHVVFNTVKYVVRAR